MRIGIESGEFRNGGSPPITNRVSWLEMGPCDSAVGLLIPTGERNCLLTLSIGDALALASAVVSTALTVDDKAHPPDGTLYDVPYLARSKGARFNWPRFGVKVRLRFVNGTDQDIDIEVHAESREALEDLITPKYIMRNVSDDWGPPIGNVDILSAEVIK